MAIMQQLLMPIAYEVRDIDLCMILSLKPLPKIRKKNSIILTFTFVQVFTRVNFGLCWIRLCSGMSRGRNGGHAGYICSFYKLAQTISQEQALCHSRST